MRMIGHLIDCADMLKNKVGCSTLCAIAPEHVPSEEKNNDAKEDKVDEKEDTWIIVRNKKRDVNGVTNGRRKHEVMESDAEEHDE